jgi:hypothetical protein
MFYNMFAIIAAFFWIIYLTFRILEKNKKFQKYWYNSELYHFLFLKYTIKDTYILFRLKRFAKKVDKSIDKGIEIPYPIIQEMKNFSDKVNKKELYAYGRYIYESIPIKISRKAKLNKINQVN